MNPRSSRALEYLRLKTYHAGQKRKVAIKSDECRLMMLAESGHQKIGHANLNARIPALLAKNGRLGPQVRRGGEHGKGEQPLFDPHAL